MRATTNSVSSDERLQLWPFGAARAPPKLTTPVRSSVLSAAGEADRATGNRDSSTVCPAPANRREATSRRMPLASPAAQALAVQHGVGYSSPNHAFMPLLALRGIPTSRAICFRSGGRSSWIFVARQRPPLKAAQATPILQRKSRFAGSSLQPSPYYWILGKHSEYHTTGCSILAPRRQLTGIAVFGAFCYDSLFLRLCVEWPTAWTLSQPSLKQVSLRPNVAGLFIGSPRTTAGDQAMRSMNTAVSER
jgi:hypothetical protein